jgi:membrane-associated phospholipid phosphatase
LTGKPLLTDNALATDKLPKQTALARLQTRQTNELTPDVSLLVRGQAQLKERDYMATICKDATCQRLGLSWPVQMLIGLAVTAALVAAAYFFVDLPVLFFVRDHGLNHYPYLKWLTRPPEAFVTLSPFVLVAGLLRRWFGPWTRLENAAVAAAVSTLLTALAALLLKMTFGRSCPDLVPADGLSLARAGAYGFYPFHVGAAFWAFPSGHTACTLSVTSVAQAAFPRQRLFWWSIAGIVAAALIALNYHFVGDVPAGAFVGWAVGGTAARLFGLKTSSITDPVNCPRIRLRCV